MAIAAIIVAGGYNSVWPLYLPFARYLEELAGIPCITVPLMPREWRQAAQQRDATNILQWLERTVTWARQRLAAEGIISVGHSAGGVISRLYVCGAPVWGHSYSGLQHTDWLITMGSPHCSECGTDTGWFLTDEANRLAPGAPHKGRIQYRSVAGRSLVGKRHGHWRERRAHRAHHFFGAQEQEWGDGVVPISSAALTGAELVVLTGVTHSRRHGSNWYGGSADTVRRWWPDNAEHTS